MLCHYIAGSVDCAVLPESNKGLNTYFFKSLTKFYSMTQPSVKPTLVSTERKALISPILSLNNSVDEGYANTINDPIIIRLKRNAGSETKAIDMRKHQESTVKEFKKKYLAPEIEEGLNIRFIYEGKQLKEEDKICTIKFKNETYLHVFASKPIQQQENNITIVSADAFDNQRRGFDKLRGLDILEEEIILFRGKFHSKNILILKHEMIVEQVLFEYEEEWLRENPHKISDSATVRKSIEEYDSGWAEARGSKIQCLLGFLLGFLLCFLAVVWVLWRKPSVMCRRGIYIGFCFSFVALFLVKLIVYS